MGEGAKRTRTGCAHRCRNDQGLMTRAATVGPANYTERYFPAILSLERTGNAWCVSGWIHDMDLSSLLSRRSPPGGNGNSPSVRRKIVLRARGGVSRCRAWRRTPMIEYAHEAPRSPVPRMIYEARSTANPRGPRDVLADAARFHAGGNRAARADLAGSEPVRGRAGLAAGRRGGLCYAEDYPANVYPWTEPRPSRGVVPRALHVPLVAGEITPEVVAKRR